MQNASARPVRRDVERNRVRVVAAARAVFAERGLRAGHNDVARAAGLGVATVYRHFPTKEALIEAALAESQAGMAAIADDALAAADPWDGLVLFLERGSVYLGDNLGIRDIAFDAPEVTGRSARHATPFDPVLDRLLRAAHGAGKLREGITVADLTLIHWTLTEVAHRSRDVDPSTHRRFVQVILDGLQRRDGQVPLGEDGPSTPAGNARRVEVPET